MGTHGSPPTRVLEDPVKWTRPVRSPTDLQVGPKTLSATRRPWKTPGDLIHRSRRTYGACGARFSPGCGMALPIGPQVAGFTL
jgi:hypothetical protein